jgi:RNA polymerase sigma factor (TIGR02999 family)
MAELTQILSAVNAGESGAASRLFDVVYHELRQLATQKMARERVGHTLQPTALVHEVWLRLGADAQPAWNDRAHFFAAAAEAMRRILVDRARRKQAQRRGEGAEHVPLDDVEIISPVDDDQLISLDDALQRFAVTDGPKAELVKLKYFVGLTTERAAEILNISAPTAKRWWAYSKAWLYREVKNR